eukprot:1581462-Heterocapsa_arctica.AAC.1
MLLAEQKKGEEFDGRGLDSPDLLNSWEDTTPTLPPSCRVRTMAVTLVVRPSRLDRAEWLVTVTLLGLRSFVRRPRKS